MCKTAKRHQSFDYSFEIEISNSCGDTFYWNPCQTSSRSKNYGKGIEYPLPLENGTPYFKGKAQKVFFDDSKCPVWHADLPKEL